MITGKRPTVLLGVVFGTIGFLDQKILRVRIGGIKVEEMTGITWIVGKFLNLFVFTGLYAWLAAVFHWDYTSLA